MAPHLPSRSPTILGMPLAVVQSSARVCRTWTPRRLGLGCNDAGGWARL